MSKLDLVHGYEFWQDAAADAREHERRAKEHYQDAKECTAKGFHSMARAEKGMGDNAADRARRAREAEAALRRRGR